MWNLDPRIFGADPHRFSEFIDSNGLVCFQPQTDFTFREDHRVAIIRVSNEVWLQIHGTESPVLDRAFTADELLIAFATVQVDDRIRHFKPGQIRWTRAIGFELEERLFGKIGKVKPEVLNDQFANDLFGLATERRDRQIKTLSLEIKRSDMYFDRLRSSRRDWLGRGRRFVPASGY